MSDMLLPANGIQLHWNETGEGEPLLWLHGAMGCGTDWRYIFKEAPAGYRIIAPDLRGHGGTANPSGAFTFRQCADDVLQLKAHLGLGALKAIGLSGGGIVLLHMAILEPASIDSMVIVSAPTHFPEQARAIMRQMSETTVGEAEMAQMRVRHPNGEAQIQQLFGMARGFADSYHDVNFTPAMLSGISARTLIVFGDRDPLYPVSIAVDLHQAIPQSSLWVVPNGGHGPVFGPAAARFEETALAFLRGE